MLFYPLWVLFSQFSCELAVLPLPVSVDKGWLKPRCVEFIERSFWQQHDYQGCVCVSLSVLQILLVLQKNLKLFGEFYRSCEQMVLYFMSWKKKQHSLWHLNGFPILHSPSSITLQFFSPYLLSVFLPLQLPFLSSVYYFPLLHWFSSSLSQRAGLQVVSCIRIKSY